MSTKPKQKVVLITGASSGIGAGTAVLLASKGYQLSITGRDVEALQKVAQQCQEKGLDKKEILVTPGDQTKDEDIRKIVESTLEHFGKLDVLINNAGILVVKNFEESSMDEFDSIIATNLRAPVYLTKLCTPHLIQTKGNIINVSSVTSLLPVPAMFFYGMAKTAMDQFTKSLAQELAPKGVRVNSVNPGSVWSNIAIRTGMSQEDYKQYMDKQSQRYPIRKVGEVDDVAHAIAFLISDEASFIVGVLLPVDGGRAVMS